MLKNFLTYLEGINAKNADSAGVILIYFEQRKFVPFMILEAMAKYDLLPRFFNVVKGCVDGFSVAETRMGNAIRYFTLKQIEYGFGDCAKESTPAVAAASVATTESTTMTATTTTSSSSTTAAEKERCTFEGDASVRVRLAYQIMENLAKSKEKDGGGDGADEEKATYSAENECSKFMNIAMTNAQSIDNDVEDLSDQNKCMERQNSLRPIFVNYFKVTLYHRVKAVTFRRILAEHEYDLEALEEIWNTSKKVRGVFYYFYVFIYFFFFSPLPLP